MATDKLTTSIDFRQFFVAIPSPDGSVGTDWIMLQSGTREGTAQFNGSSADRTTYKNIEGKTLQASTKKGDKTLNFQFANLNPKAAVIIAGGSIIETTESTTYIPPANQNVAQELSAKLVTGTGIVVILPRVAFDSFPMFNDDDLGYFTVEGILLAPEKQGVTDYRYSVLTPLGEISNDITAFVASAYSATATIDDTAHTVVVALPSGTDLTTIVPHITTNLGAWVSQIGETAPYPTPGEAVNFSAPVKFKITSFSGSVQEWTITITASA